MKILFLTIGAVYNFNSSGAYTDLLKCFYRNGHDVYAVGAIERRLKQNTTCIEECGINILRVKVGNITKTGLIEKGISMLTISNYYEKAILFYYKNVKFDIILYTTPPITIAPLVQKLKKKYNAYTYLLLKDIFPQNAVDIGILSRNGARGIIYRYFQMLEKNLYRISDKIGCMSTANVAYLKKNNPEISVCKLEVCPNTIDALDTKNSTSKFNVRKKYGIPTDRYILLYGGNFGKPQDVNYIIKALKCCHMLNNIHFVLCGSGTEFHKIVDFQRQSTLPNITILKVMDYEKYIELVLACDIGLLFLDHRFTIPNFPSRLLDYMRCGLPVIAATDRNTDVGRVIESGEFGWWVESKNPKEYCDLVKKIFSSTEVKMELKIKSRNAKKYLQANYETERAYTTILKAVKERVK